MDRFSELYRMNTENSCFTHIFVYKYCTHNMYKPLFDVYIHAEYQERVESDDSSKGGPGSRPTAHSAGEKLV